MKKIFPLVLGVCLLLNCFLGTPIVMAMGAVQVTAERDETRPIKAATVSDTSQMLDPNVIMSVRFDNRDRFRTATTTPVYVTIENKGEAFEGEIRIRTLGGNPYDTNNSVAYDYVQTVDVPTNNKETFTVPFKVISAGQSITTYLYSDGEKRAQVIKKTHANDNALIGLVSKREADLNYWKKNTSLIHPYAYNMTFEYIDFTPDSLPREAYYLDGFSVLVLHHIEWSELDEVKQNKLTEWVYNGGMLVVDGDVANAGAIGSMKPLVDLKADGRSDAISQEEIEQELNKKSSQLYESLMLKMNGNSFSTPATAASASSNVATPTSITPITLGKTSPQGTELMKVKDIPIVQSYSVGTGAVVVTSFDLASPFAEKIGNDFIGTTIFPEVASLSLDNSVDQYTNWGQLMSVTENISWRQLPSAKIILSICVVFILCVGPITYFILKKLDKRDWIWGIAPVLAVVCSGLFIVYGYQHHGSKPVSSTVTILNNKGDGHYVRESFISIGVPKTDAYKFEFDVDGTASNNYFFYDPYAYDAYSDLPERNPDLADTIYELGQSPRSFINFPKIPQWTMESVLITDNTQLEGGIDCQVYTGAQGKIYYTVANNTGHDLEDVSVWALARTVRIDFIANEDTKTGEFPQIDSSFSTAMASVSDPWSMIDSLYGLYDEDGEYREKNEQKRSDNQEKYAVLSTVSNRLFASAYQSSIAKPLAVVYGWNKGIESIDAFANGEKTENVKNMSIIMDKVEIEFIKDGYLSIPDGYLMGMIVDESGTYMADASYGSSLDIYLDGENSKIIQFDIPEGHRFDFTDLTFSTTRVGREVETEILNTQKKQWNPYVMGRTIKEDQTAQYIDALTGSVRIKFSLKEAPAADVSSDENFMTDNLAPLPSENYDDAYVEGLSIRVSGKEKINAGN